MKDGGWSGTSLPRGQLSYLMPRCTCFDQIPRGRCRVLAVHWRVDGKRRPDLAFFTDGTRVACGWCSLSTGLLLFLGRTKKMRDGPEALGGTDRVKIGEQGYTFSGNHHHGAPRRMILLCNTPRALANNADDGYWPEIYPIGTGHLLSVAPQH
ncbi:hypothetical protein VUR80DRAFT_5547 [Thermomyces stellatus]